jgi:hypothetical protein
MRMTFCREPLGLETLTQYWLGELAEDIQSAVELHLFSCAHCAAALEEFAAMAAGMRSIARRAEVATILTPAFVETMRANGARIREYVVEPGGSVNCTITADDDLALSHLRAPLEGVERLDVQLEAVEGGLAYRFTDVPFNPAVGEIVLAPRAQDLRGLVSVTQTFRLVAVGPEGDRPIGEYVFRHSPSRQS